MLNTRNSRADVNVPVRPAYAVLRHTARLLLAALTGFMLARTPAAGSIYPFATAFAAAVPAGGIIPAVIGATFGYITAPADALRLISAAVAAGGIRWTFAELDRINSHILFPMAAAFSAVISTGLIVGLSLGGFAWTSFAALLCEAMLGGACAFFFSQALAVLRDAQEDGDGTPVRIENIYDMLDTPRTTALIVALCTISVPLCRLSIAGFRPFAVVMLTASGLAARRAGISRAALAGMCAGIVIAAAAGSGEYIAICSAGALAAGLFAPLGVIPCAAAFGTASVICSLTFGSLDVFFIIQAVISSVICAFFPNDKLDLIFPERTASDDVHYGNARRGGVLSRLRTAANGLSGVSGKVLEVSSRLDSMDSESAQQACRQAARGVCESCGIYSFCWGARSGETAAALDEIAEHLSGGGNIRAEPERFARLSSRCARWDELSGILERLYNEYSTRERSRRRVSRVRSVMAEQLGCVSSLLTELADELDSDDDATAAVTACIYSVTERYGFEPCDAAISCGTDGRLSVLLDIRGCEPDMYHELAGDLSDALGCELKAEAKEENGVLELTRVPPLRTVFGAYQCSREGGELCGDMYDALLTNSGKAVMILSDGMGTGGRAAVDAAMACGLMRQLIEAGFGIEGAMGMVNSSLMLRSEDEALATVDCVSIDLFSGAAVFRKAGAAASFVLHGRAVSTVYRESLPLGIMTDVDSAAIERQLDDGDIILMVSDGVVGDGDCAWIRELLLGGDDMRALAQAVVEHACGGNTDDCNDDMTALAIRVEAAEREE